MRSRTPLALSLGLVLALMPGVAWAEELMTTESNDASASVAVDDEGGAQTPLVTPMPSSEPVPAPEATVGGEAPSGDTPADANVPTEQSADEAPGTPGADEPAVLPSDAPATDEVQADTAVPSQSEDAPEATDEAPASVDEAQPASDAPTRAMTPQAASNEMLEAPAGTPAAPEEPEAAPALADGAVYSLANANASTLAVAATKTHDVQLAKNGSLLGEYWRAFDNGDGSFMLVNLEGNRALAVDGSIKSGANVIVSSTGTKWMLLKNADGSTYTVIPLGYEGLCLDVKGGGVTAGTTVQLYKRNGTAAQSFLFTLNSVLTEAVNESPTLSGAHTIKPADNTSYSLDVASGSKASGANIRLWTANGTLAQTYDLTSLGNGLYVIRAGHSGKCLDVKGGSTTSGANVQQYARNNTLAQIWYLIASGSGYRILNAKSGLALDLAGSAAKGTNIQVATRTDKVSQVFAVEQGSYLANGSVYTFAPQNAPSLLMLVKGNSASSTAAVVTGASSNVLGQYWRVKSASDGSFTLVNLRSNAALSAQPASKGTALKLAGSNGTPFVLLLNDDGTFTLALKSKTSMVVDVKSGSTTAGAALQLWGSNGSKAQKLAFTRHAALSQAATKGAALQEGIYRIAVGSSKSYVLDIANGSTVSGGNVQLWTSNNSMAQKYQLISVGNGLYTIQAANSGKLLGVAGGSTKSGANAQQANRSNALSQYWYFVATGGDFSIRNAKSGLALDVTGGKIAKGSNIQLHTYNGTAAERFAVTGVPLINDGTYAFSSALTEYGMLALDMAGGSTTSGGNAQVYQSNGSVAQKWQGIHQGTGTYRIKNAKSGLYLEVASGSKTKGANVQQGASSSSNAQKWVIGITDDGGLTFKNVNSGMYLDVAGGKAANGTNVQQWTRNGSRSQGWVINTHHTAAPAGKLGTMVKKMIYYADIASVGYDQSNRWDVRDGGECDCSSLVITCLKEAGFNTGTSSYTGDMSYNLTARGWKRIGFDINKVKPGDILLNDWYHVCVVISGTGKNALIAQASIDENGNAMGGKAGDQSGYETNIKKVYTYSSGWDCILRYG